MEFKIIEKIASFRLGELNDKIPKKIPIKEKGRVKKEENSQIVPPIKG
jgi:hypothetical protein